MKSDVTITKQRIENVILKKKLDAYEKKDKIKQIKRLTKKAKTKVNERVQKLKEKKLEYKILERIKSSVPYCNYCAISDEPVLHEDDSTADIGSICADCKKDFENDNLSYCELCGRLQRNRQGCYCSLLKDGKFRTLSTEEGTSQTIESHLAKKTKELEKKLKTTKEELNVEREEIAKFQEKSEE
nr:9332_t:CDS:2 [Entrophospora candida]